MLHRFNYLLNLSAKNESNLEDEHIEPIAEGGGGKSKKKKQNDREALKAKVAAQLKQIRQFQDAFTSSNINPTDLLNA